MLYILALVFIWCFIAAFLKELFKGCLGQILIVLGVIVLMIVLVVCTVKFGLWVVFKTLLKAAVILLIAYWIGKAISSASKK